MLHIASTIGKHASDCSSLIKEPLELDSCKSRWLPSGSCFLVATTAALGTLRLGSNGDYVIGVVSQHFPHILRKNPERSHQVDNKKPAIGNKKQNNIRCEARKVVRGAREVHCTAAQPLIRSIGKRSPTALEYFSTSCSFTKSSSCDTATSGVYNVPHSSSIFF